MKNIIMYSGPMCNFCEAAKRLFVRNNMYLIHKVFPNVNELSMIIDYLEIIE